MMSSKVLLAAARAGFALGCMVTVAAAFAQDDDLDFLFSDSVDAAPAQTAPSDSEETPAAAPAPEPGQPPLTEGPAQEPRETPATASAPENERPPVDEGNVPEPYEAVIQVSAEPEVQAAAPEVRRPSSRIEEIVVTAQKRAEDVRDVPIAMSVMSGDELRKSAVSSFDDMARFIPNVSFNTDFNSLYLRGIGTAEVNVIGEQAVVYMVDDVYVSRLDFLKPGFMDLRQIEVLKGPQGTLYGRNATGGVVNIGIGQPDDEEWNGSVNFMGGQREILEAEAVVGGPIGDRAGLRIAGRMRKEDGSTLNLHDGSTMGDKDIQQARARVRVDLTDSLELVTGIDWFDYFIGVWAGNETFVYPGALRPVIQTLDPDFETELNRRGSANLQNRSQGEGVIAPLKLNWSVGEHEITAITAYAELNDLQGGDLDGNGAELAWLFADTQYSQVSQELRLVSPPGDFEYVAGLFYFSSELATNLDIPLAPNLAGLGNGLPLLQALSTSIPALGGVLGTVDSVLDSLEINQYNSLDNLNGKFNVDVDSYGIFGQMTWRPTDTLSMILGGRFSSDVKRGQGVVTDQGPLPVWEVIVLGGYDAQSKVVDNNFSPKMSVTWEPSDEVTLYATYAQGFRAGSFNAAAFDADDFEFDAETSDTYESGVKTSLFDGLVRFNLGAFYTLYRDYQLSAFNGFGYVISNAEKVRSQGFESDVTALLWPGLILQASVGFNDAEFAKHTQGSCPTYELGTGPVQGIGALPPKQICDLSGKPLFRAPRWTGSLRLGYEAPLFSTDMDVILGADATFKSGEFIDSDLDPFDWQGSYWLYNARVGLKSASDRWRFEIHGKNLSNELVKTFSGDIPLQAGAHWALTNPPRTVFATIRLNFE